MINENNLINLADWNKNGRYDILDFIFAPDEKLIEECTKMKFDCCLMNPPFSDKKIGDNFYKNFIHKCVNVSNKIVTINPDGMFLSATRSKKDKDIYKNRKIDIEFVDKSLFDAGIRGNIIIVNIINNFSGITININGQIKTYKSPEDIRLYKYNFLYKLENQLNDFIRITNSETIGSHFNFGPKYTGFTRRDLIIDNPDKNKLYIIIYKPNSSFNGLLYSIHNDGLPIKYNSKYIEGTVSSFITFEKNELDKAKNCIKYLNSNFVKICLLVAPYITKKQIKYLALPWLDFSKSYTDEELFNMIGMEYDKELVEKILNDKSENG